MSKRDPSIMSSSRNLKETRPLLSPPLRPPSYNSLHTPSSPAGPAPEDTPLFNHVSRVNFFWIVSGLWSAVFLGALDGTFPWICRRASPQPCPNRHSRSHTRIAHWKLLQQVRTVLVSRHFLPPVRLLLHPLIWSAPTIIFILLPLNSYQVDYQTF